MTNFNVMEQLSSEVLAEILSYIPSQREKSVLSLVSRSMHKKLIPYLYNSWEYHGGWPKKHRSLFDEPEEGDYEEEEEEGEYEAEDDNDEDGDDDRAETQDGNGDAEVEKLAELPPPPHPFRSLQRFLRTIIGNPTLASQVRTLDLQDWSHDFDMPYHVARDAISQDWDQDVPLIESSLPSLQIEGDKSSVFETHIRERDEETLAAILIAKLPNLQTLYMMMPAKKLGIQNMIEHVTRKNIPGCLERLEKIYVGSALHLGMKGHWEYFIEFDSFVPFFHLKALRHFHVLTPIDIMQTPLQISGSNVTLLALEEAEPGNAQVLNLLTIPNALKSFRWSQTSSCFSIGSCHAPFYGELGQRLSQHKDTLEHLDVDFRFHQCRMEGHAANPYAKEEDMIPLGHASRHGTPHLIGSLLDFKVLKSLTIDPLSLYGDKAWGVATVHIVDSLPPSLESLKLLYTLSDHEPVRQRQLQEQVWIKELASLADTAPKKLPKLSKIEVLILDSYWPSEKNENLFTGIESACQGAGIMWQVSSAKPYMPMTNTPYFVDTLQNRTPGRNY